MQARPFWRRNISAAANRVEGSSRRALSTAKATYQSPAPAYLAVCSHNVILTSVSPRASMTAASEVNKFLILCFRFVHTLLCLLYIVCPCDTMTCEARMLLAYPGRANRHFEFSWVAKMIEHVFCSARSVIAGEGKPYWDRIAPAVCWCHSSAKDAVAHVHSVQTIVHLQVLLLSLHSISTTC